MNSLLSSTITVDKYRKFVEKKEADEIVEFIKQRFTERYVVPMRVDKDMKNGFTIMAISCLMIESLESFRQGWPDSNRKSQLAFCNFFDRYDNFSFMRGYSEDFYKGVRCGILHQGETTNGWHIRRDGVIFKKSTKTINSKLFHDQVEKSLLHYCDSLSKSDWNSDIWVKLRKKMKAICDNCNA